MTVRTTWLLNPGQTRADTRLGATGTWTPTDATQTRSGVVPGGTALNLTGSTMTGTVALGRAVIQGTSTQGAYGLVVTAAETINVANGHASLNRIDSVFAVINDSGYDTSGTLLGQIQYVQGTASASPTAPTSPGNSTAYLKLWDIAVAAGSSAGSPINWATALTDQRVYTVGVGGINPGGSSVVGAFAGQWRDGGGSAGILERYNGSAWEQAVRLGNSGLVSLGDISLTRSAASTAQVNGNLSVTGNLTVSGIGQTQFAIKAATTSATNNTTQTDDGTLQATIAAAGTYTFDLSLLVGAGDSAADIRIGFSFPTGTCHFFGEGAHPTGLTSGTNGPGEYFPIVGATSGTSWIGYAVSSGAPLSIRVSGVLIATATGTLKLQWAQLNTSATATQVLAGSWMRTRREV
jgi:hypothetical protein